MLNKTPERVYCSSGRVYAVELGRRGCVGVVDVLCRRISDGRSVLWIEDGGKTLKTHILFSCIVRPDSNTTTNDNDTRTLARSLKVPKSFGEVAC